MTTARINEFVRSRITLNVIDLRGILECVPEKHRSGRIVCALERVAPECGAVHTIQFDTADAYIIGTNWGDNELGLVHRVLDAFPSVEVIGLQGQGLQRVTAETLADLAARLYVLDVRHTAAASVYRRDITAVFTDRELLGKLVRS